MDELPEFKRNVLEVLRQPMEGRIMTISRANFSIEYPASFMLVASMNPCSCGYYNHPESCQALESKTGYRCRFHPGIVIGNFQKFRSNCYINANLNKMAVENKIDAKKLNNMNAKVIES
jgi:hypothetical protein